VTLYFEGHSDDTVAWTDAGGFPIMRGDSLDDCARGDDFVFTVGNEASGGVRVVFAYARGDSPGWAATFELLEEDVPIPWPISLDADGYTVRVRIDGSVTMANVKAERRRTK
jgi:hypothetical protein